MVGATEIVGWNIWAMILSVSALNALSPKLTFLDEHCWSVMTSAVTFVTVDGLCNIIRDCSSDSMSLKDLRDLSDLFEYLVFFQMCSVCQILNIIISNVYKCIFVLATKQNNFITHSKKIRHVCVKPKLAIVTLGYCNIQNNDRISTNQRPTFLFKIWYIYNLCLWYQILQI